MTDLLVAPSVSLVDGRPATTSFAIAEHFGKRHDHVVRDIRKLMAELPEEERAPKFGETFRTVPGPNNSTRQEVYFVVYFDGFILLAMGYTGKQALQIKLVYIAAFNAMRDQLAGEQPAPALTDAPITPDQQCTLQALVRALVEKGGIYAAIWSRFNNHFRLGSYKQLPQSRMSEAVDYLARFDAQTKALPKEEAKALPSATHPNILPIRINFLRTRDFKKARRAARLAGDQAYHEARVLSNKLEKIAREVWRSFAPDPDECRPSSYFDGIIRHHENAMKRQSEIIAEAIRAFSDQCSALESLAAVLEQSDNGTEMDSVKMMHVIMEDGTGERVRW